METQRSPQHVEDNFYDFEATEDKRDVRGWDIFDARHKPLGMVSDIFISRNDQRPIFVEITPLANSSVPLSFYYPFDNVKWLDDKTAHLSSTLEDLLKCKEYQTAKYFEPEDDEVMSIDDGIMVDLEEYFYPDTLARIGA